MIVFPPIYIDPWKIGVSRSTRERRTRIDVETSGSRVNFDETFESENRRTVDEFVEAGGRPREKRNDNFRYNAINGDSGVCA